MTRSQASWLADAATGSPTARASSALLGLRSTFSPHQITTGVSAGATPSSRRSVSAAGYSSRSIQLCGSRLRAANSRSRRVSGEWREPTIRSPVRSPIRIERRMTNARRIRSPSTGSRGDELAQPVRGHDEDLAGLAHDRGHEHGLARQQVELAEEPPRAVYGNQALGAVPRSTIATSALQYDDEVVALVPRAEDHVARARVTARPMRFQRRDLLRAEAG